MLAPWPIGDKRTCQSDLCNNASFLYYSAVNPSTRRLERKVTFVKRVVVYGLPILVGSGYYHPDEGP